MKNLRMARHHNALHGAMLSFASAALTVGVYAQEEVSDEAFIMVDEIVVTARRRAEQMQDVPVAISAFGEKQIKERGIDTEADLQMNTPGLQVRVTNSSNQLNYSIRGQTVDSFSGSQPAVLAYVNDVQAGGVSASAFFDMESIQVLKGPQGTLFGRNATGGAVLYQTKRPEKEFGGYVKLGYGNFDNRELEGVINIPVNEHLGFRIAGLTRERDGWQENLYNGDMLASIDSDNLRVSISYTDDKFENHFTGYYAKHGGKTEGLRVRNAYDCLVAGGGVCLQGEANPNNPDVSVGDLLFATELYPEGALLAPAGFPLGELVTDNPRLVELGQELGFAGFGSYIDAVQGLPLDKVYNDQSNDSDIEHVFIANTTTYEINDNLTIKNIFGYNKNESFQATDVDGSPFMLLRMGDENSNGGYQYNVKQVSDELQLSGVAFDDKLDYIVGVYYYVEDYETDIPLKFIADYSTDPFGPAFTYHALVKDVSKSVFAQGSYALTDQLDLTLGGRYTWEKVSIQHYEDSAYFLAGVTDEFTSKVDLPSWLASLSYRINDEHMVYVSQRGSWRTGGYNVTSINVTADGTVPDSFRHEKTWDVELGYKFSGRIGSVPARINLAAYRQVIKDAQRTVYLQITSQTGNVGEAVIKGIEIDGTFDVTNWLELGGAFAYTDAQYTDPQGDVIGYTFDFGPYADAPELQWSIYFLLQQEIDNVGHLSFRGDFYSNDDTYFSNLNNSIGPGTELDGYKLLNFRLSLEDIGGTGVTATAYARNVTNKLYERGGLPLAGVTATNATITGEPRTYGFELSYNF